MKNIKLYVCEADEFNPAGYASHKKSYNSFIKWYDKQLNHMNKEELIDMLETIVQDIKDDQLDTLK